MAERCSCGTVQVEGAAFCHRCGKPQREQALEIVEPEAPTAALVPEELTQPPAPAPPVSFANSVAVRVGFLTASISSMLIATPVLQLLFVVWPMLAGYLSVVLYRRRTGRILTVREGARLGRITGVLNSLIAMVFFTLNFVIQDADKMAEYHARLNTLRATSPKEYALVGSLLESSYFLGFGLLLSMALIAAVLTLSAITGGALGARLGPKQEAPHTN